MILTKFGYLSYVTTDTSKNCIEILFKFIQKFPTIESLAISKQETVLKYWEGLGYYKRAINLHDSAKVIIKKIMEYSLITLTI